MSAPELSPNRKSKLVGISLGMFKVDYVLCPVGYDDRSLTSYRLLIRLNTLNIVVLMTVSLILWEEEIVKYSKPDVAWHVQGNIKIHK